MNHWIFPGLKTQKDKINLAIRAIIATTNEYYGTKFILDDNFLATRKREAVYAKFLITDLLLRRFGFTRRDNDTRKIADILKKDRCAILHYYKKLDEYLLGNYDSEFNKYYMFVVDRL